MKNTGSGEADIIWIIKEDSAKVSPLFLSNSLEVSFHLKNNKPLHEVRLSCGVGNWSVAAIKNFVDDLESLTVIKGTDSLKFRSEEDIFTYLRDNRKGLTKRKIYILIQ